jgi:hypothetical protein
VGNLALLFLLTHPQTLLLVWVIQTADEDDGLAEKMGQIELFLENVN